MSCPHCYIDLKSRKPQQELSLKEIIALLDELADLGTLRFTITGGEPALRDDLIDIVKAAADRRFTVSLKTSAYPLDEDKVNQLWDAGLTQLQVSLYHIDLLKHDQFVGRNGAWAKAVCALDRFSSHGGRCILSIIGMQWNADSVFPLIDFSNSHGWRPAFDAKIMHRVDGSRKPCDLFVTESSLLALLDDERLNRINSRDRDSQEMLCKAGTGSPYILPNGSLLACPILPWEFGNLRNSTFRNLWLKSSIRKRILALRWSDSVACDGCLYVSYCSRCPGDAILENGDPNIPSTTDCYIARIRYQHATKQNK